MTIKELIQELSKFPEDSKIIDYEGNDISTVEIDEIYDYDEEIDCTPCEHYKFIGHGLNVCTLEEKCPFLKIPRIIIR